MGNVVMGRVNSNSNLGTYLNVGEYRAIMKLIKECRTIICKGGQFTDTKRMDVISKIEEIRCIINGFGGKFHER